MFDPFTDTDCEEEMEMPTPCQKCGEIFDLNDGANSEKWFPGTIICASCGDNEQEEIERDDEIETLREEIENAEADITRAKARLSELGVNE